MSEGDPSATRHPRLPADLLRTDPARLDEAASRVRSKQDLIEGIHILNQTLVARAIFDGGLLGGWETDDTKRHMARGAALACSLISEGTDADDTYGPHELTDATYGGRLTDLHFARKEAFLDDSPKQPAKAAELEEQISTILKETGLDSAFDEALGRLTGEGLEEPTRPEHARYGAALVVLGMAITPR